MKTIVKSIKRFRGRTPYTSYLACTTNPLKPIRLSNGKPAEFPTAPEAEAFAADWVAKQEQVTSTITWYRPSERLPESRQERQVMLAIDGIIRVGWYYNNSFRSGIFTTDPEGIDWWAELPAVPEVGNAT